jgi:N-acetylmuramoyl-L-alanine amidase
MLRIDVRNRLWNADRVARAAVEIALPAGTIGPSQFGGVTNNAGILNLNIAGLPNGDHVVRVLPERSSTDEVGPDTANTANPPNRIFRPGEFHMTTLAGNVIKVERPNRPDWVTAQRVNASRIRVELQPVWMLSQNSSHRGRDITLIIVHHTGGADITPAIADFATEQRASAHYVIDTDGQIVKMVRDQRAAWQAGTASWQGSSDVNEESIGIEIVNKDRAYPEAQYTAVLGLLTKLRSAFGTIPARRVVGHSDVAIEDSGWLGRKAGDPGLRFEWVRVENLGLGLIRTAGPSPNTIYGGFFVAVPDGALRQGDNDGRNRFGGVVRRTVTGNPVIELQRDLKAIGYHVGRPDGDFGRKTHEAVAVLQEHFFAGGRGHKAPDGRVDFQTATLIKQLVP